jgi:glycosyltransferase involved in cell wall biosynthesis
MNQAPLISVIIPVFNRELYIQSAIESLFHEKDLNLEIIVIDDGSTDSTVKIVKSLQNNYSNITLILSEHGGAAKARNIGIKSVSEQSNYITFLDSDDLNVPGRLKRQLMLLEKNPNIYFVVGLLTLFEQINEKTYEIVPGSKSVTLAGLSVTTMLLKKEVFNKIGIFDETMTHAEDIDFNMRLMEKNIPHIKENLPAILYRRHKNNISNDKLNGSQFLFKAIRNSLKRRRKK